MCTSKLQQIPPDSQVLPSSKKPLQPCVLEIFRAREPLTRYAASLEQAIESAARLSARESMCMSKLAHARDLRDIFTLVNLFGRRSRAG